MNDIVDNRSVKSLKIISERLYEYMQMNAIPLTTLSSFAKAQKLLSTQDLFDYIAYNDCGVVSTLLCSDKIKGAYLQSLESAFDFYSDYEYKYIESVIAPAYNKIYPGLSLENSYSYSSPGNLNDRMKSIHNAFSILGYSTSMAPFKTEPKTLLKKENIDMSAIGSINLPDVNNQDDSSYSKTSIFFKIIETDHHVFVVIKPAVFSTIGQTANEAAINNEYFSICTDIEDNEPTTLPENLFVRVMSIISKKATDNLWASTQLGRFYFRTFVIN